MTEETKVFYYIGDESTPYVSKVNIPPKLITLGDFKAAINKPNYKFFFKSEDQDFGVVKEEITDDACRLPLCENRIVAWLVAPEVDQAAAGTSSNPSLNAQSNEKRNSYQPNRRNFPPDPDTFSISSSNRGRLAKSHAHPSHYDSLSTLSSSDASTLYYDSRDDTSEYSTYTDTTNSTRYKHRQMRHRYKKRKPRLQSDTTSTYSSSITDSSLSLNIISATINMEKYNFLGISIVGQSNERGDGGIYIGSIMKGGAVAADGRIEPGDMLLQVNDINFENLSNEDAVRELRNIVHKPGSITLTVAKCWDPNPQASFFAPRDEPVRPIDPATWASHITAIQGGYQGGLGTRDTSSDNLTSSLPESERYEKPLSIRSDMSLVVRLLKMPDSGLDVRTRMWLKITIPDAFIGSDLVDWLMQKVEGLSERRDARKYASSLLKAGYIKHTVKKITFSEQCYYVFGDYSGHKLLKDMGNLSLGDSNSDRDSDTLGPLPVSWDRQTAPNHGYPSYNTQFNPYQQPHPMGGGRPDVLPNNGVSNAALDYRTPSPGYGGMMPGPPMDADAASLYSGSHRAPSVASLPRQTLASFGASGSGGSGSDQASERLSVRSGRSGPGSSGERAKFRSDVDKSSDPGRGQRNIPYESPLPPYLPPRNPTQRPLNSIPPDVSGSRESFQRAMDNPCDYFAGHL